MVAEMMKPQEPMVCAANRNQVCVPSSNLPEQTTRSWPDVKSGHGTKMRSAAAIDDSIDDQLTKRLTRLVSCTNHRT